MKKNFLVIETKLIVNYHVHWFTHFINLKENTLDDLKSLFHHLEHYQGQQVTDFHFSETRLTNW